MADMRSDPTDTGGLVVVTLFVLLFGTLSILRLDGAWVLARRAAGHDQRGGALGRIFAATAAACASTSAAAADHRICRIFGLYRRLRWSSPTSARPTPT